MRDHGIIGVLFLISLFCAASGFILSEPVIFGLCSQEQRLSCRAPLTVVGQPLVLMSLSVSLIFLILLFLSEHFYRSWLKFAAWTIPLGAIWIIFTPVNCDAPLGLCLDKELVTWYASGLVLAVSLIVIIVHAFRNRKGKLA